MILRHLTAMLHGRARPAADPDARQVDEQEDKPCSVCSRPFKTMPGASDTKVPASRRRR